MTYCQLQRGQTSSSQTTFGESVISAIALFYPYFTSNERQR